MSLQPLELRVYRIVAELFDVPIERLSPASSPETIEMWDSVGHLNLVLALEQEFGVRLSTDQMDQMADLERIVRILAVAEATDVGK